MIVFVVDGGLVDGALVVEGLAVVKELFVDGSSIMLTVELPVVAAAIKLISRGSI